MMYEVTIRLRVDEGAHFLEVTPDTDVICVKELFEDLIYDIDDIGLEEITVERD